MKSAFEATAKAARKRYLGGVLEPLYVVDSIGRGRYVFPQRLTYRISEVGAVCWVERFGVQHPLRGCSEVATRNSGAWHE